mgnify:CR=1 FL=1
MLLLFHPFHVGDYIVTQSGYEGTVRDISMMYTTLETLDRRRVVLPNAGLSITIVERTIISDSNKEIGGGPRGMKAKKVEYVYIETRVEPLLRPASPGSAAEYVARLRLLALARTIADLKSKLQRTSPVDDQPAYNRMFANLLELEKRRRELHEVAMGPAS